MKLRSMKSRIIFTMVLVILGVSTIFSVAALLMKWTMEEAVLANMVENEVNIRRIDYEAKGEIDQPKSKTWSIYLPENYALAPEEIKHLPLGVHHSVRVGNSFYQVERQRWPRGEVAFMYDITEWEYEESRFLVLIAYSVMIVFVFSVLMTKWATKAILEPVKTLSYTLTSIPPAKKNPKLNDAFAGTEIHEIAGAFDTYSNRLESFIEREQMFTSAASHELRTPLSVMMGAVDILEIEVKTPTADRALQRIRRACSDMRIFIEATLFLSREHAKLDTSVIETNPYDVVEKIIEDNAQKMKVRRVVIKNNIAKNEQFDFPISMIKIVASNLIRNALEHSSESHIDVNYSDGVFSVRDFGVGIPKEDLPKVFNSDYSTKQDGTGMGLHLVKRIADRFNWRVEIKSEAGLGTMVNILFK